MRYTEMSESGLNTCTSMYTFSGMAEFVGVSARTAFSVEGEGRGGGGVLVLRFVCLFGFCFAFVCLFLCCVYFCLSSENHFVRLVVKASASRAEDPGFESRLRRDFSGVESYQWLKKMALQFLPCQAPGVVGSVLGLVGPVSVYCDWVRWKVWSATPISVWQHVKLSWADPSLRYTRMLLGC